MFRWIVRLLKGKVPMPDHPELDERELHLDEKLLRVTGASARDYEEDQRRRLEAARRLRVFQEAASYRRTR